MHLFLRSQYMQYICKTEKIEPKEVILETIYRHT